VVVVGAALLVGFAGGCGSEGGLLGNDGGTDGLPISTGTGGAVVLDAHPDQPTDVPEEHGPGGLGGAPGAAGASGAGGALGLAGMFGTGGMGTGGLGVGGMGIAGMGAGGTGVGGTGAGGTGVGGTGVGGTGVGGTGVGGTGVGGTGVGGTGVGGTGVGGSGVGGAGVGGSGVGGTGVGGSGVGGSGVGGATGTDAGVGTDGAVDAAPATLTQIWTDILSNRGASPAPGCVLCHDGGNNTIPNYSSAATAFATLVGVDATNCAGKRVVAGDTEHSVLINKLRAQVNFASAVLCGGNAMPRGARRISAPQLHMIESWITAGALNN
jgi:hypothetical protein